jgi:hypothetical protein
MLDGMVLGRERKQGNVSIELTALGRWELGGGLPERVTLEL